VDALPARDGWAASCLNEPCGHGWDGERRHRGAVVSGHAEGRRRRRAGRWCSTAGLSAPWGTGSLVPWGFSEDLLGGSSGGFLRLFGQGGSREAANKKTADKALKPVH
jgi:hypothetical protein